MSQRRFVAPTAREIRRMYQTALVDKSPQGKRNYLILRLLSGLGLRTSEVSSLKVCDVDFDDKTVLVRGMKFPPSKLPIDGKLSNEIKQYVSHNGLSLKDHIIPLPRHAVQRIVRGLAVSARVRHAVSPQKLRRFMILDIYRRSKSLRITRAFARHVPLTKGLPEVKEPTLDELRKAKASLRHRDTRITRRYERITSSQTKSKIMRGRWNTWIRDKAHGPLRRGRTMRLQHLVRKASQALRRGSVSTYERYAREDFYPFGPLRVFKENGRLYVYLERETAGSKPNPTPESGSNG